MRLALDTNRDVDLCKGLAPTVGLVAAADAVFLPFVVVAELRAALVLEHDLVLHARDEHFDRLPQLPRV